jgi:hypothetical protein
MLRAMPPSIETAMGQGLQEVQPEACQFVLAVTVYLNAHSCAIQLNVGATTGQAEIVFPQNITKEMRRLCFIAFAVIPLCVGVRGQFT